MERHRACCGGLLPHGEVRGATQLAPAALGAHRGVGALNGRLVGGVASEVPHSGCRILLRARAAALRERPPPMPPRRVAFVYLQDVPTCERGAPWRVAL